MIKAPKWDEKYNVGIPMIDDQHKELFRLVEKVYTLEDGPNLKNQMRVALYELSAYLKKHFKEEEELMKSVGYEHYKEHCELHHAVVINFNEMLKQKPRLEVLKTRLKIWAKNSLLKHIVVEDSKMKFHSFELAKEAQVDEELTYL